MSIVQPIVHKQPMGFSYLKIDAISWRIRVPYGNVVSFCFRYFSCVDFSGVNAKVLKEMSYKATMWGTSYGIRYTWFRSTYGTPIDVMNAMPLLMKAALKPVKPFDHSGIGRKIEVTFTKVDEQLKRAERVLPFLRGSPNGRFRSSKSRASTLT